MYEAGEQTKAHSKIRNWSKYCKSSLSELQQVRWVKLTASAILFDVVARKELIVGIEELDSRLLERMLGQQQTLDPRKGLV